MSSTEFMTYAGPCIILIFQQLHNLLSSRRAKKTQDAVASAKLEAEITAAAAKDAAELAAFRAKVDLRNAVAATAGSIAATKQAAAEKLETIHTLVNGNLQAEKDKNAALAAQVTQLTAELAVLRGNPTSAGD
jgi:hypothetical protein